MANTVKNSAGVALPKDFVWTFSTVTDTAFLAEGKEIFRFETFGDETQWSDTLGMFHGGSCVARTRPNPDLTFMS